MSKMDTLDWLRAIASEDERNILFRSWVKIHGTRRVIGSDGKILAAVPSAWIPSGTKLGKSLDANAQRNIASWLDPNDGEHGIATRSQLRRWCGRNVWSKEVACLECEGELEIHCDPCGGEGICSRCNEGTCIVCKGKGRAPCGCDTGKVSERPEPRTGKISTCIVDRVLLGRLVAGVDDGEISVYTRAGLDPIALWTANDVGMVLMPMRGGDGPSLRLRGPQP